MFILVFFLKIRSLWRSGVGGVGHVGVLCFGPKHTHTHKKNKLAVMCLLPAVTGQAVLLMRSETWKEMSQRVCY